VLARNVACVSYLPWRIRNAHRHHDILSSDGPNVLIDNLPWCHVGDLARRHTIGPKSQAYYAGSRRWIPPARLHTGAIQEDKRTRITSQEERLAIVVLSTSMYAHCQRDIFLEISGTPLLQGVDVDGRLRNIGAAKCLSGSFAFLGNIPRFGKVKCAVVINVNIVQKKVDTLVEGYISGKSVNVQNR
jgi:hypothetical protein